MRLENRGAVGQAHVQVQARRPKPRGHREQVASLVQRVLEQYRKTGSIPGDLRRRIIREEQAHRWGTGEPTPLHLVEKYIDEWMADLLLQDDAKRGATRAVEVET